MQDAGARPYDYGLRINKSLAMEPRICGVPPARTGLYRRTGPAHIAVRDHKYYSGATEVLQLATQLPLTPHTAWCVWRLDTWVE